ncbi:MAG: RIP metalloprotease RseP [Candidatus Magasanikbacteria bacterium]|nr:RIP metalloprotease RseP [Candidatus Magasanikbacteria bacterium]
MLTVLLFILILGILVIVHECGHFIMARCFKIQVYEFGFGFPPRAFGIYRDPVTKKMKFIYGKGKSDLKKTVSGDKQRDEFPSILWSFNWLPLGGFVRIKGENGEEAQDVDSFGHHKAWKRITVLVAGVTMNFLLAGVILGIGFMIGLPADLSGGVENNAIIVENAHVVIQQVQKNSPAEAAGLRFGDKILRVEVAGEASASAEPLIAPEISSRDFIEYLQAHSSEYFSMVIDRGGETIEKTLIPEFLDEGDEYPRIGIALADAGLIRYPWYIAVYKGFVAAFFGLLNIFIAFYYLIKNLLMGQGLLFDVAGPVGIATIVGQSAKLGFNYVLNVAAMLSLSLAAINILPIPALDGGRVLFVVIEKIIGRPVSMKHEQLAHTIGFVLLMALIVVVTFRDIVGLF